MATIAPSCANRTATARPMPDDAPVTSTCLPLSRSEIDVVASIAVFERFLLGHLHLREFDDTPVSTCFGIDELRERGGVAEGDDRTCLLQFLDDLRRLHRSLQCRGELRHNRGRR